MSIHPNYFYHETLLNCTKIFGTLFNDIKIKRKNSAGTTKKEFKVKLTYSPKDKLLERLRQDPNLAKKSAINLPIIGFELTGMNPDTQRKNNSKNRRYATGSDGNTQKSMFEPVPWNLNYSVYIMVDKRGDGLQIVEQILPFFNPNINIPTKLIYNDMGEIDDVQIILNDVTPEDTYEGTIQDREIIQWTLGFTMKMNFFHPVVDQTSIIKKIITNIFVSDDPQGKVGGDKIQINTTPGLTSGGDPTTVAADSIDADNIQPDDDYGFIEEFLDVNGS